MLRLLPAVTVIATLAVAPLASAQAIAPKPVAPSAGKSLARGKPFTFKARLDPSSGASGVFLKVSKSKRVGSDGTLAKEIYFREMKRSGNTFSKRVERYARDGFTALVHGKHYHEETRATVSQVARHPGGKYLVVRDMDEAESVCRFIETGEGVSDLASRLGHGVSEGFSFSRDLERIGVARAVVGAVDAAVRVVIVLRTRRAGIGRVERARIAGVADDVVVRVRLLAVEIANRIEDRRTQIVAV